MGMTSRRKGKTGELDLAKHLREQGFDDARRGVQYQGGNDSPDVVGLFGYHVECKRTERLRLYEALDQATADAGEGEVPVIIHRKSRRQWVAILPLEHFLKLVPKLPS